MYDHLITAMAAKLIKDGAADFESIRQSLKEYWEDKIAAVWTVDDVDNFIIDNKLPVTYQQADLRQILENTLEDLDGNEGINWTVLEEQIKKYFKL